MLVAPVVGVLDFLFLLPFGSCSNGRSDSSIIFVCVDDSSDSGLSIDLILSTTCNAPIGPSGVGSKEEELSA